MAAQEDSTKVTITGHGVTVSEVYEIDPYVFIVPPPRYSVRAEELPDRTDSEIDRLAILLMGTQTTFALEIRDPNGGEILVSRAWNALWDFDYVSLSCAVPCFSLFSFSDGTDAPYILANRNLFITPHETPHVLSEQEIEWIQRHHSNYRSLLKVDAFQGAMRAYSNSHYLFDRDLRIMLIWSGIERLLGVDGELRRRLALYAALLLDGTADEKEQHFDRVRRAYDFRSKIVHGVGADESSVATEYTFAALLLARLLAKCVTLGRVPTSRELDIAAMDSTIR
jgi:hypothetical protein